MSAQVIQLPNTSHGTKYKYEAKMVMHSPGFGRKDVEETRWTEEIIETNIEAARNEAIRLGEVLADETSADDAGIRAHYRIELLSIKRIEEPTNDNKPSGGAALVAAVKAAFTGHINNSATKTTYVKEFSCPVNVLCSDVIVLDRPFRSVKLK